MCVTNYSTECKARLEHRKQESDAACDRFKAEQGRAEEAEKLIREMRKHLQQVEMNSVEQIRAKDEHIVALRKSHERLQVCVLQLHGKVDAASVFQEQGRNKRCACSLRWASRSYTDSRTSSGNLVSGNRLHELRNGQSRDGSSVTT